MIYIYIVILYIYVWIWWVVSIANLICNDLSFEFGRIRKACFKCPNYTYIYISSSVGLKMENLPPAKIQIPIVHRENHVDSPVEFSCFFFMKPTFCKVYVFFYIHGHVVNPLPSSPPHAAMPPFGMVYNPRRWISSVQFQPNLEGNRCQHVDFTILRNLDCGN